MSKWCDRFFFFKACDRNTKEKYKDKKINKNEIKEKFECERINDNKNCGFFTRFKWIKNNIYIYIIFLCVKCHLYFHNANISKCYGRIRTGRCTNIIQEYLNLYLFCHKYLKDLTYVIILVLFTRVMHEDIHF